MRYFAYFKSPKKVFQLFFDLFLLHVFTEAYFPVIIILPIALFIVVVALAWRLYRNSKTLTNQQQNTNCDITNNK